LSIEAARLETSGCQVEYQRIDLPVRSVRLRVESGKHLGEIVAWADRGMVSASIVELDGDIVMDQNFEMGDSDHGRFDGFMAYFQD
ncbi:MAG: hypothetical protein KF797_13145, partial [Flavobacteriales bacterium]|nr:hypothetical protein [Flavobacteriales bacterium]